MTNDIYSLSEEDIKLRYITPAILQKGWSVTDITMETKVKLTDGKINLRGNLVARGKAKYADYMLYMPEGYKHFSKTKPMLVDHCRPMQEWWNNRVEIVDAESGDEKSRCFSAQQLLELGCNFDQCKFPKEEEEVLRPEELLKQYHEKRTALDAKIDQTLTEIQQMLGIEIN